MENATIRLLTFSRKLREISRLGKQCGRSALTNMCKVGISFHPDNLIFS